MNYSTLAENSPENILKKRIQGNFQRQNILNENKKTYELLFYTTTTISSIGAMTAAASLLDVEKFGNLGIGGTLTAISFGAISYFLKRTVNKYNNTLAELSNQKSKLEEKLELENEK
jgi:hypothetical protein